jgi:peptide/nickel transport system substrate-binding protein
MHERGMEAYTRNRAHGRIYMRLACSIVLILLLLSVVGGGCGEGGDRGREGAGHAGGTGTAVTSGEPVRGGRLVIGMQQEPEILVEAINSMVAGVYVCNLIFSKFVKHNDRLELECDLITEIPSIENGGISPDHLTYTYHLRRDALWHDGVPVTSSDVEFSFRLMMHPDINVETRQGWDIVERIETPDEHTVVFHLSEVYANFAGDCFYDESVLPRHLLEGELGPGFQSSPFHRRPVGSGPFLFHEWVPGSHITVRANRNYYGEGPYLDEIIIRFIPDGNALVLELETGGIMSVDNAPNSLLHVLSGIEGVTVHRNPALFNEHLDLNCEGEILSDVRVRRALALATDREELSRTIYEGVWIPAFGDEHPSSPYYSNIWKDKIPFDPSAAGTLLGAAGWADSDGDGIREKDGRPLKLAITTTSGRLNRERTQMVLREQFRRIGVDLEVRNYHPTVLFASYDEGGVLKRGSFDIALYAILTPPDPSTKEGSYSEKFIPPRGQNYSRIRNRRLTDLLAQGSAAIEFETRKRIYDEVATICAEEVPIVPLLWVTQLDAMPVSLRGYRPNPTQSGDTWNASQWWLEGLRR